MDYSSITPLTNSINFPKETPSKVPPIQVELSKLEKLLTEQADALEGLDARLSLILSEPEPTPNKDVVSSADAKSMSDVLSKLSRYNQLLDKNTQRIHAILRRLEI